MNIKIIKKTIIYALVCAIFICTAGMGTIEGKAGEYSKRKYYFSSGDVVYHIISKKEVEVCGVMKTKWDTLQIPEEVVYKNKKKYKVTRITDMRNGGNEYRYSELGGEEPKVEIIMPGIEYAYKKYYSMPTGAKELYELKVKKLVLPKSLKYIGEGAFRNAHIEAVEFAPKYKNLEIGNYAFGAMAKIELPDGTRKIGECAINWIENVTIPASVKKIGDCAIGMAKTVKIDKKNKHYKMKAGMLYTYDEKKLVGMLAEMEKKKKLKISPKTTRLAKAVFACCEATQIDLGGNVREIPVSAFHYCLKLKKVKGTESVEKISYGAFCGCLRLEELEDVSSVKVIENAAFWYADSLKLPISSKMDIADCAFAGTYIDVARDMEFVIPENDPVYSLENGLLIKTEGAKKTVIKQVADMEKLIVPEGVTDVAVALGNREMQVNKMWWDLIDTQIEKKVIRENAGRPKCKEVFFPESLQSHSGCVYMEDGAIYYRTGTHPEFKAGFFIEGTGSVVVPKGSASAYETAMDKAAHQTRNELIMDYELFSDGKLKVIEGEQY